MTKNEARELALKNRKNNNSIKASKNVIDLFVSSNILDKYNNIGIYFPIGKEINILNLLEIYPNKKFYLPITRQEISFIEYNLDNKLIDGPFKTKEPVGKIVDKNSLDCIIIPCVAISTKNQRIGYGKGYYDRYLADYNGFKIGVCYKSDGNVDVECDSYDVTVDIKILGE